MDDYLSTSDSLRLRCHDWPLEAEHAAVRGTVLLVHGLGEHARRYDHVAAQLNTWGWRVTAYDQRGHGASEGGRGLLDRPDGLLHDLALAIDAIRARHAGPLVLLGHSMGGLVAAHFVAGALDEPPPSWSRPVDGLVLSSPALGLSMTRSQKLLLALMGRLAPHVPVNNGLKANWVSRDPAVVSAYLADPLVHDRVSPMLVRFIVDGGAFVRERAPRWRLPTLLMYAGADRCVAPAWTADFAATAPADLLHTECFDSLFHELFNEPEKGDVFSVLRAWLAERDAGR